MTSSALFTLKLAFGAGAGVLLFFGSLLALPFLVIGSGLLSLVRGPTMIEAACESQARA